MKNWHSLRPVEFQFVLDSIMLFGQLGELQTKMSQSHYDNLLSIDDLEWPKHSLAAKNVYGAHLKNCQRQNAGQ